MERVRYKDAHARSWQKQGLGNEVTLRIFDPISPMDPPIFVLFFVFFGGSSFLFLFVDIRRILRSLTGAYGCPLNATVFSSSISICCGLMQLGVPLFVLLHSALARFLIGGTEE